MLEVIFSYLAILFPYHVIDVRKLGWVNYLLWPLYFTLGDQLMLCGLGA